MQPNGMELEVWAEVAGIWRLAGRVEVERVV